jgi:hypothetical protein
MFISDSPPGRLSGPRSLLKVLPFLLMPLLWADGAWSTECYKSYSIHSQAFVDALGNSGCTSLRGNLTIFSNGSSDALNLDPLANITSIGGDLSIDYNPTLTNVNGLANLTSVGGSLSISSNPSLTNIDGLASLTSVGGANLSSVGGWLSISGNDLLTNLDGLANLTSVGGGLGIINNDRLTNLDGLANLTSVTSVGGRLDIYNNDALTNLDGLANLTSVGGDLLIQYNDALTNLDGLGNVNSIGGYLDISTNDALTNCRGLAIVLGWPNGPPDDAIGGDIDVVNNGAGCNSIDEIFGSVSEPTKPSIISTDSGDGEIILEISISDNGGADITRYDASCTDGTNTYIGTSPTSPITVSGLTNDVAYTCTVTAANSVGTSSASSATAPITPEQIASGLPIWLLYQATQ